MYVVDDQCKVLDPVSMLIVLRSGDREELLSKEAQALALATARARGFSARGFAEMPTPLPVDEHGQTTMDVVSGKADIYGWQVTYKLMALP